MSAETFQPTLLCPDCLAPVWDHRPSGITYCWGHEGRGPIGFDTLAISYEDAERLAYEPEFVTANDWTDDGWEAVFESFTVLELDR